MKEIPSFYSILPANARYSKELSSTEKIFFAEINALTNAYGFCNARNQYFCDLYDVDRRTVSRWLNKLERLGFVKLVYEDNQRRIYLQFNSQLQNVDNTIGTAFNLSTDGTKMSHGWDKNVPCDFINNIYNKIDLLNKNIYLDNSARQKVENLVSEICDRMHKKYPGWTQANALKSKEGIIINLVILTLAKSYFDPELVGIRLGGKFIHHADIVDLIDVFDIANIHSLASYLVEKNCEVKNLKMYIMASLFNAHSKALNQLKVERRKQELEIERLTEREIKQEKQLALKKTLRGEK